MKTMKKTMGWLVMAAALTVGMASCSNADSITEEPVQQPENPAKKTYTLTVQASKGGDNALTRALAEAGMTEGATTRTLSLSSDGKTINATWAEGETVKVGIWNQPTFQYDFHGTLTAQSSGPTTTLKGELTDINVNDELALVFHIDADYTEQGGTLQYIADNLDNDLAIVTVKSIDDAGNITITTGVTRVTATKVDSTPFSIGPAIKGSCGTVTIGGTIYWASSSYQNGGETYLTQSPLIYEPGN